MPVLAKQSDFFLGYLSDVLLDVAAPAVVRQGLPEQDCCVLIGLLLWQGAEVHHQSDQVLS